jgi:hypothetical protein
VTNGLTVFLWIVQLFTYFLVLNLADVYLLFCTNFKKISGRIADNMLMFFVKAGIDFMKKTGRCKRKV